MILTAWCNGGKLRDSYKDLLPAICRFLLGYHKTNNTIIDDEGHTVTAPKEIRKMGRVPGADGTSAECYKHFWNFIGQDLLYVYKASFTAGVLPISCTRAILSLLPKKRDLGMLKNWRPVSLLCTDYKTLSKCLANRIKTYMNKLEKVEQSYCVPKRMIMDNILI